MLKGEIVAVLRAQRGLLQKELALLLRVDPCTISKIEGNRLRTITLDLAERMADSLHTTVDIMLGVDPLPPLAA